jgi:hypothetical protein
LNDADGGDRRPAFVNEEGSQSMQADVVNMRAERQAWEQKAMEEILSGAVSFFGWLSSFAACAATGEIDGFKAPDKPLTGVKQVFEKTLSKEEKEALAQVRARSCCLEAHSFPADYWRDEGWARTSYANEAEAEIGSGS